MTPGPLDVLTARLVNLGYQPRFLTNPETADLSPFPGRTLTHTIWGLDPGVGKVAYGLVTDGPEGTIASIRGTQIPKGSYIEWIRNFEALLIPCPLSAGAKWHEGIGADYLGLTIEDGTPLGKALSGNPNLITSGHSKGGPLAIYLGLEVGAANLMAGVPLPAVFAFAPPKPGDKPLGTACVQYSRGIRLWANPKDVVPHTPLTITDLPPPFVNEDYEFPVQLGPLNPNSVTPPVGLDWAEAHNLEGAYIRMLEKAAA